jgi:pyruvate dehydrogenase (quinone)
MIEVPEQAEMAVDIACRTALAQGGVSHLTIPIDVQEKKLNGKYSRHNVTYHHTSHAYIAVNSGNRIVILVGQGALDAGEEVLAAAEK